MIHRMGVESSVEYYHSLILPPLAPKLQRQAASGGMGFVDGWPCELLLRSLQLRTTLILLVILLPFYWLYTYSTDDSIPILLTSIPHSTWQYSTDHSTVILLIILLSIYWSFCSHSTEHSTTLLLEILLPFYWWIDSHSADHSSILFYWWFLPGDSTPFNWLYTYSTDSSTPILLIILLSIYWWFCSHSTEHSTTILLEILLPFFWWLYSHSTDDSTPILQIILPFCSWFYSHPTDDTTRKSSIISHGFRVVEPYQTSTVLWREQIVISHEFVVVQHYRTSLVYCITQGTWTKLSLFPLKLSGLRRFSRVEPPWIYVKLHPRPGYVCCTMVRTGLEELNHPELMRSYPMSLVSLELSDSWRFGGVELPWTHVNLKTRPGSLFEQ